MWCPLKHPGGQILGGLWLTRNQPWANHELPILQRLSEAYAYAWHAVGPSNSRRWRWGLSRTTTWILAAATLGALAIPVPMSTLAPAKIVAKDPLIVSAPIDGVIAEILVLPNTVVSEGQVLFKYEDTTFRSEYEVAERNLDVAMAQYRRAAQGSFVEAEQKADVPLLKAEVELRETERNYAHERLTKVEVKAEQAGLLLYTDKSDWIGKPVVVGQRIMELANPQQLEVRIDLPVEDAIVLREGASATLFLNANPFSSVPATVSHASYHAEVLPNNTLAYRVTAQLEQGSSEFRIGWQGSAKIYGEQVTAVHLSVPSPDFRHQAMDRPMKLTHAFRSRRSCCRRCARISGSSRVPRPPTVRRHGSSSIRSAGNIFRSAGLPTRFCRAGLPDPRRPSSRRSTPTRPAEPRSRMSRTSSGFCTPTI